MKSLEYQNIVTEEDGTKLTISYNSYLPFPFVVSTAFTDASLNLSFEEIELSFEEIDKFVAWYNRHRNDLLVASKDAEIDD